MGGFPALAIQQPPSVMDEYTRAVQLRSLMGQAQMQQLQLQDQQASTRAMQQWDGKDFNDYADLLRKNGASAQTVMGVHQHLLQMENEAALARKNDAEGSAKNYETTQKIYDHFSAQLDNLKGLSPDDQASGFEKAKQDTVRQYPQTAQFLGNLHYQGADQLDSLEKVLMGESNFTKQQLERAQTQDALNKATLAQMQAAKIPLEEEEIRQRIGGFNIPQLNTGLQTRWQVLHPGQALPPQFTLQPGSSPKDFERIDKVLEQTEKSAQTKSQQDISTGIRQQMLGLAQEKAEEAKTRAEEATEKQQMKWVEYTDAGRTVAGPLSQAKAAGATDMSELGQKDVQDIREARNVHQLISKQGDPSRPENMGVNQLIDSLARDNKLGIVSSRLNSFLTGKVGTLPGDDPRIAALLNKADLAMTASMKAHFGASGGRSPQMLEHFLNMANARKMDAPALKAGFAAVDDYMQDRGRLPASAAPNKPPVTGKTLSQAQIAKAAKDHGVSIDEATRQAKAAGYTVQ
jgi:hypothetical protein